MVVTKGGKVRKGDQTKNAVVTPEHIFRDVLAFYPWFYDPCPYAPNDEFEVDGLAVDWKKYNYVNPPYSDVKPWVEKACVEMQQRQAHSLLFIPAATKTQYWKDYVFPQAHAIHYLHGPLRFPGYVRNAPDPMALVEYRPKDAESCERTKELTQPFEGKYASLLNELAQNQGFSDEEKIHYWMHYYASPFELVGGNAENDLEKPALDDAELAVHALSIVPAIYAEEEAQGIAPYPAEKAVDFSEGGNEYTENSEKALISILVQFKPIIVALEQEFGKYLFRKQPKVTHDAAAFLAAYLRFTRQSYLRGAQINHQWRGSSGKITYSSVFLHPHGVH